MKPSMVLFSFLLLVILLSACGGAPTPASIQNSPVNTALTMNNPTSTKSVVQPAVEPVNWEMVTLKMNSSKLTSYAPFFIADAEGFFKEYGITMDYVTFNKNYDAVPLLITGDLDIYAGSLNAGILNTLSKEKNIKVVADRGHIAPGDCTNLAILVRKDLYESGAVISAANLAGKTVAVSKADPTGFLLSTYLEQAGLTFADINLNDIPPVGYIDAFTNKSLDAIVAPELHVTRLKQAGNAVVLAKAEDVIGNLQSSLLAFGKNLLVDHPDIGARFLAAYLKGVQQYGEGKSERNLKILADATSENIDLLQAACWISIYPDGSIDFPSVNAFQQWSVKQGYLENVVTEEQFWDPSFLAAALKLLNR